MFAMSGERDSLIDNENNSSIATHQWRINSSEYYEISNKNCFDLIQDRIEQISIYSAKHNKWFVNENIIVIGGYC